MDEQFFVDKLNSSTGASISYSLTKAYDGASVARRPGRQFWVKRIRLAAIVLAVIAAVLTAIVVSALPH